MDLGCLELGFTSFCASDKQNTSNSTPIGDEESSVPVVTARSKIRRNKAMKENGQQTSIALNKGTSQITKPPHRKTSPMNWFPRKKVDSYLKRKIKMLQELDGMNLTLDETLGDANPHYTRVLKEKMAAREAAHRAMEARRAALVEASWCRILRAARINGKDAEAQLFQAEKVADEAFEKATAMGVIMYDKPNCPRKPCQIESSSVNKAGLPTHTITASFETAFDVDKQVAAAVKTAFVTLANCSSFNKDEFRDLLRNISENPDTRETNQYLPEFSSESESNYGSELEKAGEKGQASQSEVVELQKRKKRRQSFENLNMDKLVNMMVERLKCLQEDELSSLATIVATCGLNAVLAEVQNIKLHNPGSASGNNGELMILNHPSRLGNMDRQARKKQVQEELPSLDKFLVKHITKLEKEVQEAKNSRRKEVEVNEDNSDKSVSGTQAGKIPDLGSILVKHYSKFEKEIEEAKKKRRKDFETPQMNLHNDFQTMASLECTLTGNSSVHEKENEDSEKKSQNSMDRIVGEDTIGFENSRINHRNDAVEVPSLDKFLVKHVSRLEREVQEAKNRRLIDKNKGETAPIRQDSRVYEKENVDWCENVNVNLDKAKHGKDSLDKILVKPVHWLEKVKMSQRSQLDDYKPKKQAVMNVAENGESLDKILVKHVSRLEKEKIKASSEEENFKVKSTSSSGMNEGGLDQILVKHKSRLEREKMDYKPKKQAVMNVAENGESLDKILVKHVSRLEKEKIKASSEEENFKVKSTSSSGMNEGGLDQILVKHKSRLEREKMAAAVQQPEDQVSHSVARREARERELQEAWGGLSLGNSMRPHLSKMQRDKEAWMKAEEQERKQTTTEI